ncbi:MAG: hypothetical protein IJN62_03085 [Clostridia bacterium]|nr:hypothetical protein [Clostridia bacterium]
MGKFTNPFLVALKLFGIQLIVVFASVMLMPTFYALIESNTGIKVYSSITAFVFLSSYYSRVWDAGKKDGKHVKVYNKHNEDKIQLDYKKGIIIGLIAAIPNIIGLIALIAASASGLTNTIYRILQSTFMGWLGNDNLTYIPNCVIVTLIPILLSIPAYITGTKEFSLTDKYLPKIIYKKKPKKKNK